MKDLKTIHKILFIVMAWMSVGVCVLVDAPEIQKILFLSGFWVMYCITVFDRFKNLRVKFRKLLKVRTMTNKTLYQKHTENMTKCQKFLFNVGIVVFASVFVVFSLWLGA